jgi:flagellar basal body-associated protein FliL
MDNQPFEVQPLEPMPGEVPTPEAPKKSNKTVWIIVAVVVVVLCCCCVAAGAGGYYFYTTNAGAFSTY